MARFIFIFLTSLFSVAFARVQPSRNHSRQIDTALLRKSAFLSSHNAVRRQHGADDLIWSDSLASSAEQWAQGCKLDYTHNALSEQPYGELMISGTGGMTVQDAVNAFVADQDEYSAENPVMNHFTQVVWKSTTELGCSFTYCNGMFESNDDARFVVCFYSPPGNVAGAVLDNVQV